MAQTTKGGGKKFLFRDLPQNILIGTASDRYAGWIGQIYTPGRYENGITRRSHKIGEQNFTEEVLPIESVAEYFEHFPLLEIDYTFYRPWDQKTCPLNLADPKHRLDGDAALGIGNGPVDFAEGIELYEPAKRKPPGPVKID